MGLIRIKVPLLYLFLSAALFLSLGLFLQRKDIPMVTAPVMPSQHLEELRKKDGRLVQPLLLAEVREDEPSLGPLKAMMENYIQEKIRTGELRTASIFFRNFSTSQSFSVNPSEQYSPASIMKLPVLITYLKEAETHPGILEKKLFFGKHYSVIPEQTRTGELMQENRHYTVRELLDRMIINSDNDATAVLNNNIDMKAFLLLFRSLGFQKPDIRDWNYHLTAAETSRFLWVLFNCTYLNEETSDEAIRLLTKTGYHAGFTRETDASLVVAHKFGERYVDNEQQLHETGIFYMKDTPYLLTVMTKGQDKDKLPAILADVSRMARKYMQETGH